MENRNKYKELMFGGRTNLIFPDGFLTAQQHLDTILQPIVRPFVGAFGPNFHVMHRATVREYKK